MTLTLTDRACFYEQLSYITIVVWIYGLKDMKYPSLQNKKNKTGKKRVAFGGSEDRTWVSWAGKQGANHWAAAAVVLREGLRFT